MTARITTLVELRMVLYDTATELADGVCNAAARMRAVIPHAHGGSGYELEFFVLPDAVAVPMQHWHALGLLDAATVTQHSIGGLLWFEAGDSIASALLKHGHFMP